VRRRHGSIDLSRAGNSSAAAAGTSGAAGEAAVPHAAPLRPAHRVPSIQDGRLAPRYNPVMRETIILPPRGGRAYGIEAMRGAFKVDEQTYCASEWSVEPGGGGPGAHSHASEDELFLVTEGTMWFLAGGNWVEASAGTFLRIPAGVEHDFENRGAARATAFNVMIPGGFEADFARWAA
jgi:quercetin dioxygenase-like cupin family protein